MPLLLDTFLMSPRVQFRDIRDERPNRPRHTGIAVPGDPVVHVALPAADEIDMNGLYIVSGVVAFALLVYLVLALLRPEWFK
jgi:K+-transporting ATPase KdpF subunit